MPKWCLNYDSGDLEFIDENGFSYTQGEVVFNWDRSAYDEDDDDFNSQSYNYDTDIDYDEDYSSLLDDDEEEMSLLYDDD